ncbi:caspase family protein, partial [Paraburkholderia sp. Se-20369]|nr:caspase family protein [Paraburkholderia sp. Se-20369]
MMSSVCAGADLRPRATPPATSARTPSVAPPRVALVIGNGAYRDHPLGNPARDADAMSTALRALGFDVMKLQDATRQQMLDALAAYDRRLAAGGGAGLVYFAGHGARVGATTWLAPVDADVRSAAGLSRTGVALQTVLGAMSRPRNDRIDLIILDSCLIAPLRATDTPAPALPAQTLVAIR